MWVGPERCDVRCLAVRALLAVLALVPVGVGSNDFPNEEFSGGLHIGDLVVSTIDFNHKNGKIRVGDLGIVRGPGTDGAVVDFHTFKNLNIRSNEIKKIAGRDLREFTAGPDVDKLGLKFSSLAAGKPMVVSSVTPGTWAEEAGLREDDVIWFIESQHAHELEPDSLRELLKRRPLRLLVASAGAAEEIDLEATCDSVNDCSDKISPGTVVPRNIWHKQLLAGTIVEQKALLPKFTDKGYVLLDFPDRDLFKRMVKHFNKNQKDGKMKPEPWSSSSNVYGEALLNHDEAPTYLTFVEAAIAREIKASLTPIVEAWAGKSEWGVAGEWGVREYSNGASLQVHADMVMSNVISAIIHVSQSGILEDWPLTLVTHDGTAVNITLKPGEVVLYEASSCAHGRPHPLRAEPRGRYGNYFLYWRPLHGWAFSGTIYASCQADRCPIPESFLIRGPERGHRQMYHPKQEVGDYKSTLYFDVGHDVGKLGFKFAADRDGKLPVVTNVHKGQWAESAGLRVGDVLFELNGEHTSEMSGDVLRVAMKSRPLSMRAGRPVKMNK